MPENLYICPMHPEVQQNHPGNCPKCGMKLVLKSEVAPSSEHHQSSDTSDKNYTPLIVIALLITLVTSVLSFRDFTMNAFSWKQSMSYFMAGFFLVFSGFKLMDLKGFAEGYSTYDLLARKIPAYGFIYPFLELGLGLMYLVSFRPQLANWFTIILMGFSALGVIRSLLKKQKIQCACLGTFLKVPLTNITLIEDFLMIAMALLMIYA